MWLLFTSFASPQLLFEAKREKEGKEFFKSKEESQENMKNHLFTIKSENWKYVNKQLFHINK